MQDRNEFMQQPTVFILTESVSESYLAYVVIKPHPVLQRRILCLSESKLTLTSKPKAKPNVSPGSVA